MDLPTCPACDQSVLDDDAVECPFCGAAMDGSSPAKERPKPKKKRGTSSKAAAGSAPTGSAPTGSEKRVSKAAASKSADDDDPFAIEKPKTARKVLPCAPRPMKGRPHKVICPMCDTQGFIPAAAVGRQVKCANKECLVPVFTAGETSQKGKAAAPPTRVSDTEDDVRSRPAREPGEKNPMILWGSVGAVLLILAAGGAFLLNSSADNQSNGEQIDMSKFNFDSSEDEPEDVGTTTKPSVDEVKESPKQLASRLVEQMVSTSRQSGNRDKPFSRSLTGSAFLRLGMQKEADHEFAQVTRVAGSRKAEYYKIGPLVEQSFRLRSAGDDAAAETVLGKAMTFRADLPSTGSQAFDAGIRLATAMVAGGKSDEAVTLLNRLQKDQSITAQIDMVREAAWTATARTLWDHQLECFSPMTVQQWHEPLRTAVGVCLAARGDSQAAVQWALIQTNGLVKSDTSASVASVLRQTKVPAEDSQPLVQGALKDSPAAALRIAGILATSASDDYWSQAAQLVSQLDTNSMMALPRIQKIIDFPKADLTKDVQTIQALGDYAASAVRLEDASTATKALGMMANAGLMSVPPAADLRRASLDLANNEDAVRKRLKDELRLSNDSKLRSRFLAYRRSVDRIARQAEVRRLQLIYALGRVAEAGGIESIQQAVSSDTMLKREVGLDLLKDWVSICATAKSDALVLLETDPADMVRFSTRTEPPKELGVIGSLSSFWSGLKKNGSWKASDQLGQGRDYQGLRSATIVFATFKMFETPDVSTTNLTGLKEIKNPLWREKCLAVAAYQMSRAGRFDETESVLRKVAVSPTQKIAVFFGALRGVDLK